jgi:hypothetical protein
LLEAGRLGKRSVQIFTLDISEDMLGWVGLNRAVERGDGKLEISPVIGVRHQAVEALVAKLLGIESHRYIPPTISTPLGYLMPNSEYTACFFESGVDNVSEVEPIIECVRKWGYPFMDATITLKD